MSFFPSASQVLHLLQNQIHQDTVNVCCTCCTWLMQSTFFFCGTEELSFLSAKRLNTFQSEEKIHYYFPNAFSLKSILSLCVFRAFYLTALCRSEWVLFNECA